MTSPKLCVVLTAALVAGCSSTPNQPTASSGAVQLPAVEAVERAPGLAPESAEVLVVDASNQDPGSAISCRDMLKPASNVIVKQCMSEDDWKKYKRQQELWAQQQLRRMQGSAFP